ncbi:MAG: hypothetical protein JXR80_04335 [Deltaproteobacteria bacterium]|nr:hypothetical protein [Deltaproteobacteria bacterium]
MMKTTMAKIILACSKKPLAAYLERELVGGGVDCRVALDVPQLRTLLAEYVPDILLFDATFSTASESAELLAELRSFSPQIVQVGIFEPFGENQAELRHFFSPENTLLLPCSGAELYQHLNRICGLEITKKKFFTAAEEGQKMAEPHTLPLERVELTEIIEEGLPLDEIPGLNESKASEFLLNLDADQDDTPSEAQDFADEIDVTDMASFEEMNDADDFSDTLDDFADPESAAALPAQDAVAEELSADIGTRGKSSAAITGDLEALLSDDEFVEVAISDNAGTYDPVPAQRRSVGSSAAAAAAAESSAIPAAAEFLDDEDAFVEDDLSSIEDLLADDSLLGAAGPVEKQVQAAAAGGAEPADESEFTAADFTELIIPEVEAVPESSESEAESEVDSELEFEPESELETEFESHPESDSASIMDDGLLLTDEDAEDDAEDVDFLSEDEETQPSEQEDSPDEGTLLADEVVAVTEPPTVEPPTAEPPSADSEVLEDYLLDDEMPGFSFESAPEVEPESESRPGPMAQSVFAAALSPGVGEPELCPEPPIPDFSQQIERMTQQWSKQLLQSTYASMDKMIQAIGDLAPTIVDQVAREIIPPLAEKVIKAEIARLEKSLELEEESGKKDEG